MITRGTNEPAGAPNSPSSIADTAPSDSELPAAVAAAAQPDVVDVTGSEEAWTRAPARRTSEPAALRASKRAPAKAGSAEAAVDPRKGKMKLVKRPTPRGSAGLPKKSLSDSDIDPNSELEDKAPAPPSKKPRKSSATAKTKPSKETPSSKRPTATSRSDGGFDLTSLMTLFTPGVGTEERASPEARITSKLSPSGASAASHDSRVMQAQVQALQDEVARLRALLVRHETPPTAATATPELNARPSTVTMPNTKGELPPTELCYLTTSSFPEGAKKAKGDYNPPQAHLLAASRMFRAFGTQTGKPLSAMSFVLWLRELESVKFRVTPAVLMAIFSGRLGSRGLTVMHFKESSEISALQDGSTNVNFASDFSPSASLPSARIDCSTYEDILDALHGLTSFGQELWYDHMRKLMSRLRNFVGKNKPADPENTRSRARETGAAIHDTSTTGQICSRRESLIGLTALKAEAAREMKKGGEGAVGIAARHPNGVDRRLSS
ncbi:unnamed protein product [Phytophthora fragariaefolia]|uniref:Unnamed protein product n=1 Tax=Phytophthora fragariaefolia TaxID=1490495 RepID=A0A9W6WY71_9STRA|nr:unnamed protein product [Phytophthora fragariaefolia]